MKRRWSAYRVIKNMLLLLQVHAAVGRVELPDPWRIISRPRPSTWTRCWTSLNRTKVSSRGRDQTRTNTESLFEKRQMGQGAAVGFSFRGAVVSRLLCKRWVNDQGVPTISLHPKSLRNIHRCLLRVCKEGIQLIGLSISLRLVWKCVIGARQDTFSFQQ